VEAINVQSLGGDGSFVLHEKLDELSETSEVRKELSKALGVEGAIFKRPKASRCVIADLAIV